MLWPDVKDILVETANDGSLRVGQSSYKKLPKNYKIKNLKILKKALAEGYKIIIFPAWQGEEKDE